MEGEEEKNGENTRRKGRIPATGKCIPPGGVKGQKEARPFPYGEGGEGEREKKEGRRMGSKKIR